MLKEYFTVSDIVKLKIKGFNKPDRINAQATKENWLFRTYKTTKKDGREYHISNFPSVVREKIVSKLLEKARKEARRNGRNIEVVENSLRIAYSRLEIVLFVKKNKVKVESFCKAYNNREFANKEISEVCYENVASISKTRVYEWIKQYDKLGLEGIRFKADERKLGKSNFEEVEDMNIKQLVIGALLNKPHLKVKVIYKFLLELGKKKNIKIPSYRWVCRVIEDYKKNNKQEYLLVSNPDAWKSCKRTEYTGIRVKCIRNFKAVIYGFKRF